MSTALPELLAELPRFPSVDALYADDERRRRSPEWDYGVHWHASAEDLWPHWRVSWVVETGDLYAVRNAGAALVLLLGNVPRVGEYPYADAKGFGAWHEFREAQLVERVLDRWWEAEPLLSWIVERVAALPRAS